VRTFGEELKHFSHTIDIIEKSKFEDILRTTKSYLEELIYISKYCILQQRLARDKEDLELYPNLNPRYGNIDFSEYGEFKIKEKDGQINGLSAFSYSSRVPIWVIPEDGSSDLKTTNKYIELWSNTPAESLPEYRRVYDGPCCTLIAIPLTQEINGIPNRFGVLFFESDKIVRPSKEMRDELEAIAYALGTLFLLVDVDNLRKDGTNKSISSLIEAKRVKPVPTSLFLSYSGRADEEIIRIIYSILEDKFNYINIIDWKRIRNPGRSVMDGSLVTAIQKSKYAICYFSELYEETNKYIDNPNVLIESGMVYALINTKDVIPKDWIPIRESQSPDIPFNFAGNQILLVNRVQGRIKQEFSHELTQMLETIMSSE
jgi:hypothetical protein